MSHDAFDRREFVKGALGSAAAVAAAGVPAVSLSAAARAPQTQTRGDAAQGAIQQWKNPILDFGVVGINHNHIAAQVNSVLRGGGALKWVYAKEPDLLQA